MGYGSTQRFLEEAVFMEAESIGRGAHICALGDQTVRLPTATAILPINPNYSRHGVEVLVSVD